MVSNLSLHIDGNMVASIILNNMEKEMATHSSILAWEIPWTVEPGAGYSPWGHRGSDTTELPDFHFHFSQWQLLPLKGLFFQDALTWDVNIA